MTELLDTDSCRHLANHREASTSSRRQPASPCVDRIRSSTTAKHPHILLDNCCTLHCGRTQRVKSACIRRLEREVGDINRYLRIYLCRLNDDEQQNRVARDWRLVARLLDRLFFFMYVSTVAVSLATIFPKG